ncbi:MAG: ATP-binding cassette domain-containing protein [Thermodesulfobacteriota bacterium]
MDILKVEKLFLNLDGRQILKDLNLSIKAGNIHSILGPNASGKSSLAYALMGCCDYFVKSGKIYFMGEDVTRLPVDKRAKKGLDPCLAGTGKI